MNILITGASGFVGKNLTEALKNIRDGKDKTHQKLEIGELYCYDVDSTWKQLDEYCAKADFVFNLAGVNRPQNPEEFMTGNFGFASTLLDMLKKHNNLCPVMLSSSTQATRDNEYGRSKKAGEELFFDYAKETGARVLVYRLPNLFGKWCRPNYNSAVATFCYNIARDLPVTINDPATVLNLVYIDDLVAELIRALEGTPHREGDYCAVPVVHTVTLGQIVELLQSFRAMRRDLSVPDMKEPLTQKLYSTYLSYLSEDGFSYPLKMNCDPRGSFTEILRTADRGQFSVNITRPGISKGNHWHHSKNEKFVVVSGEGMIRFRRVGTTEVIEYPVSGKKIEVVDIPPGYIHNISNVGTADLVVFMWCNECFDPERPDTCFEEV